MKTRHNHVCAFLIVSIAALFAFAALGATARAQGAGSPAKIIVAQKPPPADFPLVAAAAAPIFYSGADAKVVSIAAHDLAADIERVTGKRPSVSAISNLKSQIPDSPSVIIGTIGQSPLIDALVASGKLDVSAIKGQWESFLIATVDSPIQNPKSKIQNSPTLVIAGSDPRGTAFGVFELSQAIGVSPWHWWADVAPAKRATLAIAAGARHYGPPSVKYRGIFINDEDWGLQPWAETNFEPENKGIGPKTYEKVCELLLRLKANTLWPAMHKVSPAFNLNPANAALAGDYSIIMGSSHAEPMLRNNLGEWTAPPDTYNYAINPAGVRAYWEERARANARYENIYTLGMRGIHDSPMQGGDSPAEQIALLEKIFADQRALLAKYVSPAHNNIPVDQIPQMFCPYKEVLDLYRGGLRVPDDVTILLPDDNFGYIRGFPTDAERNRSGGAGIYYHVSYLGTPYPYLWLCTAPPALIWEEMHKAYELGARRLWILNVGDIKPSEIDTEFFMQMAWDINRWTSDTLPNFLPEWAAREFGPDNAAPIAAIMEQYYLYNFARRPEHLQWWLPSEKPFPSKLSQDDRDRRRDAGLAMTAQLARVRDRIPAANRDAFYELVDYPVQASVLANNRYFTGEEAALRLLSGDRAAFDKLSARANAINLEIANLTRRYNESAGGVKWKGIMPPPPGRYKTGTTQWQWRIPVFEQPQPPEVRPPLAVAQFDSIIPAKTTAQRQGADASAPVPASATWRVIPGLGQSGSACALIPANAPQIPPERAATDASILVFKYTLAAAPPDSAPVKARIHILPTFASDNSGQYRLACAFDTTDAAPQFIELPIGDGGPAWTQGVLSNERIMEIALPPAARAAGDHKLAIHGLSPGMVIDRVTIE